MLRPASSTSVQRLYNVLATFRLLMKRTHRAAVFFSTFQQLTLIDYRWRSNERYNAEKRKLDLGMLAPRGGNCPGINVTDVSGLFPPTCISIFPFRSLYGIQGELLLWLK